ncbi:hypothetical protein BU17DRAFT_100373 [Hysterangium stoloniferum]|nr:hypothetical protein BU17DRAFT_100373 [Hysterangium stoloniferum]
MTSENLTDVARLIQNRNDNAIQGYLQTAALTFFLYDYLLTLPMEIKYLWKRRIGVYSLCFLAARYFGVVPSLVQVTIGQNTPQLSNPLFTTVEAQLSHPLSVLLICRAVLNLRALSAIGGLVEATEIENAILTNILFSPDAPQISTPCEESQTSTIDASIIEEGLVRRRFQLQTFPSTFSFSSNSSQIFRPSGETPDFGLSTTTLSSTHGVNTIVAGSMALDPVQSDTDKIDLDPGESLNPMKVNYSSLSEFHTVHEAIHRSPGLLI